MKRSTLLGLLGVGAALPFTKLTTPVAAHPLSKLSPPPPLLISNPEYVGEFWYNVKTGDGYVFNGTKWVKLYRNSNDPLGLKELLSRYAGV